MDPSPYGLGDFKSFKQELAVLVKIIVRVFHRDVDSPSPNTQVHIFPETLLFFDL